MCKYIDKISLNVFLIIIKTKTYVSGNLLKYDVEAFIVMLTIATVFINMRSNSLVTH